MSKDFYGKSSQVQAEIEFKDASFSLKCAAILLFGVSLIGAGVLAAGCIFEINKLMLAGVLIICLVPLFMVNMARLMLSEENKKVFAYRLFMRLFPGIGLFFFAAIVGAQFADDLERYILNMVKIGLPCVFLVIGICLLRKKAIDGQKENRCSAQVWATCTQVEEVRSRMTLTDDLIESRPFDDYNKASFFTPTFSYEYNGQTYVKKMEESAGNLNADFAPGTTIKLRINPNNPEEVSWSPVPKKFEVGIGALFVAVAVITAVIEMILVF